MKVSPKHRGAGTLFQNPKLERLTKTNIAVPLVLYSLVSIAVAAYGLTHQYISVLKLGYLFVLGLLAFSLVEYLMHRFLFHLDPKTEKQKEFAFKVHGVHHEYPKDKDRLAMPIPLSLILSSAFFFLFLFLMGNAAFGFFPGFILGYAAYLGVHYAVHAFQPPKNFLKGLWVHHGIHHYKDPDHAFGVSSPLWDLIFRSMPRK